MRRPIALFAWILVAVLACSAAGPVRSQATPEYTLTDLGTLGGNNTSGADVNDAGQVTGTTYLAGPTPRGFLWQAGSFVYLDPPRGFIESTAGAINSAGQAAGWARKNFTFPHAMVWTNGVAQDIGGSKNQTNAHDLNDAGGVTGVTYLPAGGRATLWKKSGSKWTATYLGVLPGHAHSLAWAMNGGGQIVGRSQDASDQDTRAFRWAPSSPNGTSGTMQDLGFLPGHVGSDAYGINGLGQVVGQSTDPVPVDNRTVRHAFLWLPATAYGFPAGMNDLGTLYFSAEAGDINDSGVVVGSSRQSMADGYGLRAFVWDSANGMRDLNLLVGSLPAGWNLDNANAVSNDGTIVGNATVNGVRHVFMATPN